MGKFEKIAAAIEKLPLARREEIAEILEALFHGDLHPETVLTEAQIADLRARLIDPGPWATDEEAEDFFARAAT